MIELDNIYSDINSDEVPITAKAMIAGKNFYPQIEKDLVRFDIYGSDENGGFYIEQHDNDKLIILRVDSNGATRFSIFEGSERRMLITYE